MVFASPHFARAAVHASIMVDASSGAIVYARNAEARAHPASLTKLMTLFITFQQLKRGRLKLTQELRVSKHAAVQQPTKLWLRPGSTISVRSAILGITTRSANDAAVVLAEGIAGSESGFARRMTLTAHRLGMKRTRFYNASGLPDRRQWTTAHDMAKLAIALIRDFPRYYGFFSVRSFRFDGHIVYGHDHLLDEYAGADGLKTGYIRASGYNLVTSAVRHKRRLVGVVLGGNTAGARDHRMMALLNRGFSSKPSVEIADHRTPAGVAQQPESAARKTQATPKIVKADLETSAPEDTETQNGVIEIGGDFSSQPAVRRILTSAIRTAPGLLIPNSELVVKLRGRHYRARFRRLDERDTMLACHVLQRKGFTCRIVRLPARENDLARVSSAQSTQAD
ncbi:MAG: D-alanyl-D-alanine carboxypeptidase family protein [Terracidiphilus sp.]